MEVNGTHIWYYFICKREVWLMVHQIAPDQEDENIEIGRFLSEISYQRHKKEIPIGNLKIDRLRQKGNELIIGEVKKSSRYEKSAYYQWFFYIDTLKKMGIEARGELLFPKEKKKKEVIWNEEDSKILEEAIEEIREIARLPWPPPPKKIHFCRQCGYREYCFAED